MSHIATAVASSESLTSALAGALGAWALLVLIAGLLACFSRDERGRDAAFRVLDRLLLCVPGDVGRRPEPDHVQAVSRPSEVGEQPAELRSVE